MHNNGSFKEIKAHPGVVDFFKELPFYNKYTEKTQNWKKSKSLKNIDLLSELRFYEELNEIKRNHAFRGYAMSSKVELVVKNNDPIT